MAGLLAMFLVLTVLARRLTLSELGVYGLLSSLAGYLLVLQNAAAAAAVRNMAAARDDQERIASFSTAALIYVLAGAITGLAIVAIGVAVSEAIDMSDELRRQARLGSIAMGLATAFGWPATVYRDVLRAEQRFNMAAVMDVVGVTVYGALLLGLVFADVDLWILIGASATIPLWAGVGSFIVVRLSGLPHVFRAGLVTRARIRDSASMAGYVSATEAAAVVIYALDRVILGLFRSAATVALFEGPVRVHNLVRALNGAVNVTVLPSAARYSSADDDYRLRELLIRGTRYSLAVIVPLAVTVMVLAGPILEVWLGPEFERGDLSLTILVSYWLVTGALGISGAMLLALGRARTLARYAWSVALGNLALSLALTPSLGLEGVALGTAIPYMAVFPFSLRLTLSEIPVGLKELARESWLPAYSLGAALAAALGLARVFADVGTAPVLVATAGIGLAGYWAAFYLAWLRADERLLVRQVLRGLVPDRPAS